MPETTDQADIQSLFQTHNASLIYPASILASFIEPIQCAIRKRHVSHGHGIMSVAVRACACNERGSACNARAMRMDPVHVRGICGFLYGSTRLMAAFYSKE